MRDLISLTNSHDNRQFAIAIHSIGIIEHQLSYELPGNAIITLSLGKSGKQVYYVKETYEEVIKRIEEAQKPATEQI
jgi:uncharacterized protein YlzI (FlbEa/FlbD family)